MTASASSTIRWTLFSGWDSVRPSELTCTPYLKRRCLGSFRPKRSRPICSHSADMARSFACSSTNRTPALTKKEMRLKTLPMSSSGTRSATASSTAIALAMAKAISWTGVAPASCR